MPGQGTTRHEEFVQELRRRTVAILDHKATGILVTFMTLWALFMDDFQARHAKSPSLHHPLASPRFETAMRCGIRAYATGDPTSCFAFRWDFQWQRMSTNHSHGFRRYF